VSQATNRHHETQGHFGSRNEAIAEAARLEAANEEGMTVGVAQNQVLVARFYDQVWDKGNVAFAHEVFADDYVRHDLRPTQALPGPAGQAKIAEDFRRAFPDLRFVVDLMLGDGALVAARWTATGTHTGPWGALDPTGKRASFSGVNIFRFHEGRVVEIWNHRDDLGLMTQLGVPVFAGSSPSA
jgi:steroid delta-isomerase-like uncharacterized protein